MSSNDICALAVDTSGPNDGVGIGLGDKFGNDGPDMPLKLDELLCVLSKFILADGIELA